MSIRYEKITKSEEDAVNEFLNNHFYVTEPLNASVRKRNNLPADKAVVHVDQGNLENDLCVKAVDEAGNILGVAIVTCPLPGLRVFRKDIVGRTELIDEVIKFLIYIDEQSGNDALLAKHNSSVADIKILSVHNDHHKKGIGSRLVEETLKLVEAKDIKALTVGCSSMYTSRIIQYKFPMFKRVLDLPFKDYVDSKGEIVFPTEEPHTAYHVYVYER